MVKIIRWYVKTNFRGLKPPYLFPLVQRVITEMGLSVGVYATPKVLLVALQLALDKAIASYNNQNNNGTDASDIFEVDLEALLQLMYNQASYVDDIAAGVKATILLSGFDAVTTNHPSTKKDEKYTQGLSGEVIAVLKKRNGATGYTWQYCEYDPLGEPVWILADCTRRAQYTFKGLTPGTKYMFRYCPTINNTLEVWSNPFIMFVT